MSDLLFIYAKDGMIKCLTMQESIDMKPLIEGQWEHTATIKPSRWIESIVNNCDYIEFNELKGVQS